MVATALGLGLCGLLPLPGRWAPLQAAAAKLPPWGDLIVVPIVISPPLEYIPTDAGPVEPPRWVFPGVDADTLLKYLEAVGFAERDIATLRAAARFDKAAGGMVVTPGAEFARTMSSDVRARLYELLTRSSANFNQQAAYRFFGRTKDEWLGPDLSPQIRALVDPLIYRSGDFIVFADIELVRDKIAKAEERQGLIKRLLGQSTTLLTLRIDDPEEVDGLAEYWGRGGRKTDIRPLLESVAASQQQRTVDVIHLLPEMARRLLYRYPKVSLEDLQKPQLTNCFWTALNFFNDQPDDSMLEASAALKRLSTGYYIVHDKLQLGDIVAFSDRQMNVFHVAVYIADDIVFTKNGYFSLAPWTLLPMDRLKGHFPAYADDWHVTFYRRKDL